MGVKVYEIQDRHVQPFYVTKNWFVYFFKREMFNLRKSIKVLIIKVFICFGNFQKILHWGGGKFECIWDMEDGCFLDVDA